MCVCGCSATEGTGEMSIRDKFNLAKCGVHCAFFRDKTHRGITWSEVKLSGRLVGIQQKFATITIYITGIRGSPPAPCPQPT